MKCMKQIVEVLLLVVTALVVAVVKGEDSQYCTLQPDVGNSPRRPDIPLQYSLKTESSQELDDVSQGEVFRIVSYNEWVYDGIGNRISVVLSSKHAKWNSHIMDWNTKQLIVTEVATDDYKICHVRPIEASTYLFPVLYGSGQEVSADRMPDPGVLLGILNWNDTHYKGNFPRRGIASDRWEWCGLTQYEYEMGTSLISMATYWSVPNWEMPIPTDQIESLPLSWEVLLWADDTKSSHDPFITSVMHYDPGLVDYSAFLIPQDTYCKDLTPEPGHPFPDLSQDTFFSFSLEYQELGNKFFTWADAWYDFGKKLYRIDHDVNVESTTTSRTTRDSASSTVVTTRLLLDYNDGVSFEFIPDTVNKCRVSLVNDTQANWASLTGLDHLWADSPSAFFGSDVTNYTYYGERLERYMVVGDWRGVRTDWPHDAGAEKTDMLWQWTFTNKNVSTITNLGDHILIEKQVPTGVRINPVEVTKSGEVKTLKNSVVYSIYDFEVDEVDKMVEFKGVRVFDAFDCFSPNWRDHMRFKLDVTSWPDVVWTPLMTSTYLNEHWHVTLANYGKVSPLRITRVQTIVEEQDEVWVEFVLLYRHSQIGELSPETFRNMTTGQQATAYLTEAVNNGAIKYEGEKPDGEKFTILALRGSLTSVVEPECTTTTSTTTTTTSTTSTTTTTSTSSSSPPATTTTTTTTSEPGYTTTTTAQNSIPFTTTTEPTTTPGGIGPPKGNAMYTPGDLAGLGMGMLLLGFALGAGGAFLVVAKGVHKTVMGWWSKK